MTSLTQTISAQRNALASGGGYAAALRRRTVLTDGVVAAFMADWHQHGAKALERLRETNVATYCKLMVLLVPRDLRVEHSVDPTKEISNEQLDAMIANITERLEQRANEAKLIESVALPPPVENPEAELLPPRSKYKPYDTRRFRRKRVKKIKLKPRVKT